MGASSSAAATAGGTAEDLPPASAIVDVSVQLMFPGGEVVWYLDYYSLPEEAAALDAAKRNGALAVPAEERGCIIKSTLPVLTEGWWQLAPVGNIHVDLHHPDARGSVRSVVPECYYSTPLAWMVMERTPPAPGRSIGGRKFAGRRSRAFQTSADGTRLELL